MNGFRLNLTNSQLSSNIRLHEDNLLIDLDSNQWMPLSFMNLSLFRTDWSSRQVISPGSVPVFGEMNSRSVERLLSYNVGLGNWGNPKFQIRNSPITHGNMYLNSSCIILGSQLAFGFVIKVDFVKNMIVELMEYELENPFARAFASAGKLDHPDVVSILDNSIMEEQWSRDYDAQINQNSMILINPKLLKQLFANTGDYEQILGLDNENVTARRIEDSEINDWFMSQLFSYIELPTFESIEGPNELAKEAITQYLSESQSTSNVNWNVA